MISFVGLGTANFGQSYGFLQNPNLSDQKYAKKEAFAILETAYREGIRFFDTSAHYGSSELILAEFLKMNGINDAYVVSKFKLESLEKDSACSLKLFGDNLKCLLWHDPHMFPHIGEAISLISSLKKTGLLLGASTYGWTGLNMFEGINEMDVFEIECNLLNPFVYQSAVQNRFFSGKKFILRSILQKGFLTEAGLNLQKVWHKNVVTDKLCQQTQQKIKEWKPSLPLKTEDYAINFVKNLIRKGDHVLISANSIDQLKLNFSAFQLNLPKINWDSFPRVMDEAFLDLRNWN